ncbi:DUF1661 domain-containing protein [Porphyromonas gingivalis]|nr:DUF1661 domain-containing protein [Porphyromonas gingivalis]
MARRSKLFKCLPIMDTGCIPPNCQLFSVHVTSRAKTEKFTRHVFRYCE